MPSHSQINAHDTHATEELARRARAGSVSAFSIIAARFEPRIYNFLLRRIGRAEDAEDLTQETFIRAWRNVHRYRERWAFSTWLYTIAARVAATHLRRRARAGRALTAADPPGSREDDPLGVVSRREEQHRLWETAERTLTRTELSALWLRYADDLTHRDIAKVLGKTTVGVRVMLFRARERLLAALEPAPAARRTSRKPLAADAVTGEPCPQVGAGS